MVDFAAAEVIATITQREYPDLNLPPVVRIEHPVNVRKSMSSPPHHRIGIIASYKTFI
jgi:hypothetical protein